MKKVTYTNHKGVEESIECENFAIGAQSHDGCALSFLGDLAEGKTDGTREIVMQVYDVKKWRSEDVK